MRPPLIPLFIATLLTCAAAHAQQPVNAQQPLILLDPAQGGSENGARIADRVDEKTVTLTLANRIAPLLRARGLTVAMTRETDTVVSNDARAALANTTHPLACILLHATAAGTGIHLYSTALHNTAPDPGKPALWDQAQAPFADRSHLLAEDLKAAFTRSKLPVSTGQTWLRPLDNMQCPAIAVEVSPMKDGTTADDTTYLGHIADIIASTMLAWRARVQALTPPPPPPAAQVAPPTTQPRETP